MAVFKLQKRERIVIAFGIVAILAIIGYRVAQKPLREYRGSQDLVVTARQNLASVEQWATQVVAAKGEQEAYTRLIRARGSFDLFGYLNRTVADVGLRDRADLQSRGTRGRLSETQLTLNGVSMKELVDLFHAIDSSKNLIHLNKLDYLGPASNGKGLKARLTLVSPKQ